MRVLHVLSCFELAGFAGGLQIGVRQERRGRSREGRGWWIFNARGTQNVVWTMMFGVSSVRQRLPNIISGERPST
nr:hypothetical protein [Kocuria rhizophila]